MGLSKSVLKTLKRLFRRRDKYCYPSPMVGCAVPTFIIINMGV
ncbi:UNVERIFIED_CONTAM: hypothetical protein GTU68_010776 [Idotea baltica]|nr:hypothetical protein [Idotea baltica]